NGPGEREAPYEPDRPGSTVRDRRRKVGLSVAAILLAVALVGGLLAWVRRDLQARGASMRAWWFLLACYGLAAVAWLIAISVPLPVVFAWLATIPAAVA